MQQSFAGVALHPICGLSLPSERPTVLLLNLIKVVDLRCTAAVLLESQSDAACGTLLPLAEAPADNPKAASAPHRHQHPDGEAGPPQQSAASWRCTEHSSWPGSCTEVFIVTTPRCSPTRYAQRASPTQGADLKTASGEFFRASTTSSIIAGSTRGSSPWMLTTISCLAFSLQMAS